MSTKQITRKEYYKKYREKNKDKIKDIRLKYYLKNKDKINKLSKSRTKECIHCNRIYRSTSFSKHLLSKKHLKNKKNETTIQPLINGNKIIVTDIKNNGESLAKLLKLNADNDIASNKK
jgi:hypothetical protein